MCNCRRTKNYLIIKEIATDYAKKTGKTVAIFYCSDWDFCEIDYVGTLKTSVYEYIIPNED